MIAAVIRTRLIVILVALFVLGGAAFYYGAEWFRRELGDKPYIASIQGELRALAAAQDSFRVAAGVYASDVAHLSGYRVQDQHVQVQIREASAEGFLAEGRSTFWQGHCVIAVGPQAGDSLPPGEPRCYGP